MSVVSFQKVKRCVWNVRHPGMRWGIMTVTVYSMVRQENSPSMRVETPGIGYPLLHTLDDIEINRCAPERSKNQPENDPLDHRAQSQFFQFIFAQIGANQK